MYHTPPLRYNTVHTARLILRPFRAEDFESIFPLLSDKEAAELAEYPYSPTRKEARAFFDSYLLTGNFWAIAEKEQNRAVGYMDLHRSFLDDGRFADEWKDSFPLLRTLQGHPLCEVGYALSASHRGMGLMTEALTALLALCQRQGILALTAYHHADNPASGHVLTKCGFELLCHGGENALYLAVTGDKRSLHGAAHA